MPPENADLCLTIDFVKGQGNPRRVFDAASLMIEGFERMDDLAVKSIDTKIEPLLVLEDVEAGSLKIWLKNVLRAVDDQALKELDWKPAIGKYLVRAKYVVLEWLDKDNQEQTPQITDLVTNLRKIASETDVRHLPDYAPVHEAKLLGALDKMQDAKRQLIRGDRITISTDDKNVYEVDITKTWAPTATIAPSSARETISFGELILTVRKPDMIGDTMWQFKHGAASVSATINDTEWMAQYHDRQIDIRPGDALRCTVKFVYGYTSDGTLESQKTEIEKVHEIIRQPKPPKGFDFDKPKSVQ